MRSDDDCETYDEEQEPMDECFWDFREERQERIDTMRGVIRDLIEPLGNPTFDLVRFQTKLEIWAHDEAICFMISVLDRFAEAARTVADRAAAAAIAARQHGVQLDLVAPRAAEAAK